MTLSLLFSLALGRTTYAQNAECQKQYIDQCRGKMVKTIGEADQATANIETGTSQKDAATAQQAAFTTVQRGWEAVVAQCSEIQDKCKGACSPSNDCKSQIDKIIKFADGKATENGQSANSALNSASQQDDQESSEARVQKASDVSNIDMIRKLQRNGPCTQSGAGSETICLDSNGQKVYIPSGPGDAFRPFR